MHSPSHTPSTTLLVLSQQLGYHQVDA